MHSSRATFCLLLITMCSLVGCSSTSKDVVPTGGDVSTRQYLQPIGPTRQAALSALTVVGCDLKQQDPTYLQGHRPHKVGLLVGSGGETITVWLKAADAQKTDVTVKTDKSFLGIAGQKNWDDQVLAEIDRSLGK